MPSTRLRRGEALGLKWPDLDEIMGLSHELLRHLRDLPQDLHNSWPYYEQMTTEKFASTAVLRGQRFSMHRFRRLEELVQGCRQ
jgi:hypothetical protein